jgi:multimeric flavodoxin WrbA
MKVLVIQGSPRKGNSAALARQFGDTAAGLGAEVEEVKLNKLSMKGCQACMACKGKSEVCVVKDDLAEVLRKAFEADIWVLATPVYYFDVTAQMKTFIDRTFSFLKPDFFNRPDPSRLAPGKKLVFIQTEGNPDPKLQADIFPRYGYAFDFYGMTDRHLVRGLNMDDPKKVEKKSELMESVVDLAKELVG